MTHDVINQPPPLGDLDLFGLDPVLPRLMSGHGAGPHLTLLEDYGAKIGTVEAFAWGRDANRFTPELRTHDTYGHRVDQVDFHPSWHHLMSLAVEHGLHSLPWEVAAGGFVARAGLLFLASQVEAGHGCPISMTASSIAALRSSPDLAATWQPRLTSRTYDPAFAPPETKTGALMGMGMTEKQGGSDVRTNTSIATADGDGYRLTGHKWFTSAPMCDGFLVLAQADGGLTCFLLPRWTPDGEVNRISIQRVKDKLGNRSNASSEIEFDQAWAAPVGDEGRGVRTIIEMVNGTRLDCITSSAGLMRQAVFQAAHHVTHRTAFGSALVDKPLMQNVIADLEIETQTATALMARVAASFDGAAAGDEREALLKRILTPVAKYWVTKRCSEVTREAMECLGGNGYVEDTIMPRLYRESPVNAIWEGSGNVIALDVLRVLTREPAALDVLREDLEAHRGSDARYDRHLDETWSALDSTTDPEFEARRLTERLAIATATALAMDHLDPAVTEAYLAGRVTGDHGGLYGTLPAGIDTRPIVEAARGA